MKSLGPYIDEAIPHEAGHILVGKAIGLPPRGLDIEIFRHQDDSIGIGNLATLGYEPPDEEIPKLTSEMRAVYMLFIAGGLAGNKFAGPGTCQGAGSDRQALTRVTDKPLEGDSRYGGEHN